MSCLLDTQDTDYLLSYLDAYILCSSHLFIRRCPVPGNSGDFDILCSKPLIKLCTAEHPFGKTPVKFTRSLLYVHYTLFAPFANIMQRLGSPRVTGETNRRKKHPLLSWLIPALSSGRGYKLLVPNNLVFDNSIRRDL